MHSWDGYLQASVYTSHDEKCFSSWRFLQWTCMCCTHNWVVCLCLISCNHNLITEPLSNTSTKSVFCSCTRHLTWQMQWVVARCCRDPTSSSQSKQFMILRYASSSIKKRGKNKGKRLLNFAFSCKRTREGSSCTWFCLTVAAATIPVELCLLTFSWWLQMPISCTVSLVSSRTWSLQSWLLSFSQHVGTIWPSLSTWFSFVCVSGTMSGVLPSQLPFVPFGARPS